MWVNFLLRNAESFFQHVWVRFLWRSVWFSNSSLMVYMWHLRTLRLDCLFRLLLLELWHFPLFGFSASCLRIQLPCNTPTRSYSSLLFTQSPVLKGPAMLAGKNLEFGLVILAEIFEQGSQPQTFHNGAPWGEWAIPRTWPKHIRSENTFTKMEAQIISSHNT